MKTPDEKIFVKILEENKFKILRFCRIYAHSQEDQEDLFQEIIFNVWRSLPSFKGNSNISSWIYKVALRVSMRFAQNKARHIRIEGFDIDFLSCDDLSEKFEVQERIMSLRICITKLNEIDQLIIILYLEDLSYREISQILGISENHVAVKMKRIKSKLFTCIKENSK